MISSFENIQNNSSSSDNANQQQSNLFTNPSLQFWRAQKAQSHPFIVSIDRPQFQNLQHSNTFSEIPQQLLKNYKTISEIGSGFQSNCFKIQHLITNEFRVAKIAKCSDNDDELMNQLKEEYTILKNLNHPSLIKLYESQDTVLYNTRKFIQIMEYIPAKQLSTQLQKRIFSENEIIQIAYQLLSIADYLHQQGIIHRDINLYNILYSRKKQLFKLIDFGVAKKQLKLNNFNLSSAGNPLFQAPEMNCCQFYSEKIDIWGIGLIVYSLLHQKIIGTQNLKKIQYQLDFKESSLEFQELLRNLLEKDQERRISASNALNLTIFRNAKLL